MIGNADKDFLLAMGVEPYEPERLRDEMLCGEKGTRARDRVIQALAIVQLLLLAAALVWTSR